MVTPTVIPVFLNGRPARIAVGSTLAQLVAQEDPELGKAFAGGLARATDARGVAVNGDAVLSAGAIFRVFGSARAADPADA